MPSPRNALDLFRVILPTVDGKKPFAQLHIQLNTSQWSSVNIPMDKVPELIRKLTLMIHENPEDINEVR